RRGRAGGRDRRRSDPRRGGADPGRSLLIQEAVSERLHGERLLCPLCLAVFRSRWICCPTDGAPLVPCGGHPLVDATIAGRYVIAQPIGEGSMGLVYRAHHVRLPREFAIKILFGELACEPLMRLRFAQEAAAASQLAHPNVVTVLD